MIKSFWNIFESNIDAKGLDLKKAHAAWKPLGRLPLWLSSIDSTEDYTSIRKANRYLGYQELRLKKLHIEGKFRMITIRWCLLLKGSKSYQMALFHRTCPDWYWKISRGEAILLFKRFSNRVRQWNLTLELKRYYILKANGKYRPIGSPTMESRMIAKSFNDLIYFVFEDKLSNYQHAYRKERGTHTALLEVWLRAVRLGQTYIYEFDFKSYFNSVKIEWVIAYLRTRSRELADVINRLLFGIRYTFDRDIRLMPEEAEFRLIGQKFWGQKPKLVRKGLPQGLSISPILATMVMDSLPPLDGLVMYADDGIIMSDKKDTKKMEKWIEDMKIFGLNLEMSKSGWVEEEFKFVGVTFNIKDEWVKYNDSQYSWAGKDVESVSTLYEIWEWFRTVSQFYGKRSKGWSWDIHTKATIREFEGTKGNWWTRWKVIWAGIWRAEGYKGERYMLGTGIYDISASSTRCVALLMKNLKDFRLVKSKSINWIGDSEQKCLYTNRGRYWERSNYVTALMDLMVSMKTQGAGKPMFDMIKQPRTILLTAPGVTPSIRIVPTNGPSFKITRIATNRFKWGKTLKSRR